jgi:RNA ligase
MIKINHKIPTLSECRQIAVQKPEFREIKKDGYVVFDYTINDSHTFDNPSSLEMRGIAFNELGVVVSLGLHKFFNYGEKQNQRIVLDGTEEVLEKLDGSMIRVIQKGDSWVFGTRAGETDYSVMTHRWLDSQQDDVRNGYVEFIEMCLSQSFFPVFEFWSSENSVVINYDKPFLKLLAIRDYNGDYVTYETMRYVSGIYGIEMASKQSFGFDEAIKTYSSMTGIEGFVIRNQGDWVKIKTEEYCMIHRAVDGIKFDKDVCLAVLDGLIDDIIPKLVEPRKSQVIALSDSIVAAMQRISTEVKAHFEVLMNLCDDRKTFAIAILDNKFKSELFALADGKDVDIVIQKRFRTAAGGIHTWAAFYKEFVET